MSDRYLDTDGVWWCLLHVKPLDAGPCPGCTIDRLARHLATATGQPLAAVRLAEGLDL